MDPQLERDLLTLSHELHADPELAYQEHRAVARIMALLERHGHKVEPGLGGLATAFRAGTGPPGPGVAFLAEYDALPGVGHGCGHNLISMAIVGSFLQAAATARDLQVGLVLIGTPAEEKGGGKIDLLNAGVFKDVVAALFCHPSSPARWAVTERLLGITVKRVTFHGLAAHAAVSPEEGRNALSALILLFVAVDGWRQRLRADARVHGIVTKGGDAQNIVPSLAQGEFGLRARDLDQLERMVVEFRAMAEGAALQTGTTVEIEDSMRTYQPVRPTPALSDLLAEELARVGITAVRDATIPASGDIGNVSQVVPADYVAFPVSRDDVAGHSQAMREAAVSEIAHRNALVTADVLAAAALRIATDADLRVRLAQRS